MAEEYHHTPQAAPEPTLLPGPINGWTGRYKACRDCGRRNEMEIEDGICATCYREQFGPLGLRSAERRREAARSTTPTPAPPPAPPVATAKPWHKDYPAGCLNCGTTEKSYQRRGLCATCRARSYHPGYTGKIAPKKVMVNGVWVMPEVAAQAEAARIAGDLARIGAPRDADGERRLARVCAARDETTDRDDLPTLPPLATLAPTADAIAVPESAIVATAERRETLVPAVVASAIVAQVSAIMDAKPDIEDIPLADLLAEVQRRAGLLEARAEAAEGDAAKYRQIRAVIG